MIGGSFGVKRRFLGKQTLDASISNVINSLNSNILDELQQEMEAREKKNKLMNGIRNKIGNISLSARMRKKIQSK